MPPTQDFLADPEGWMATHVVLCQFFKSGVPSAIERMTIVELDFDSYQAYLPDQPNDMFEVYAIQNGANRPQDDSFDAFFCPYENDNTHFVTLNTNASFMVTPTMDGCSFGVGSPSKGTVIVGHSNAQRDQTPTSTRQMVKTQRTELKVGLAKPSFFKKKRKFFEPRNYRIDSVTGQKVAATLYGIRNGNKWKFQAMKYVTNADQGQLPIRIGYMGLKKV